MILNKTSIFSFLFLFTTIEHAIVYTRLGNLPTVFWWLFNFTFIVFTILFIKRNYLKDNTSLLFIKLFLLWNASSVIRGLFIAENYWEWKNLFDTMFIFLLPLLLFLIRTWVQYNPHHHVEPIVELWPIYNHH